LKTGCILAGKWRKALYSGRTAKQVNRAILPKQCF
jgi:hypothetical protein